jgi:type I restriction enzyme S subunit
MSDVPEGYKMSEVGVIPVEWEVKTLGDVMTGFSSGATPYRGRPEYYKGNIRWITSGELNYNVITDTIEKITENAVRNTNLKIHPKGTFLMAITGLEAEGTRGSCGIVGAEATSNQSCMALFPTKELLTEYLFHYYVNYGNSLALEYCQGTKQQSYTAKIVKILPIIVPPTIEEQQAIASALSDVDALITALEQLITKKRNIKQGAMQQLLTGKKRLPGFGGEWEVKKLGEYVTIASGESPSKFKFQNNGTPYYKVDQLNYGNKYQKDTPYFIECNNPLPKGSIIFPKRGASILLNKVRILTEDAFMDTNLMTLTTIEELDNEYLYYMLIYIGLWHVADTTSIPQINNKHIKPLEIPFPSPSEQQAIAKILSDMDTEIESLEQKRDKYKAIKQGMMQELLTGKRRLLA